MADGAWFPKSSSSDCNSSSASFSRTKVIHWVDVNCHVQQGFLTHFHPRKLTWNLKMPPWKRKNIFQTSIFGFHVNFRGCTLQKPCYTATHPRWVIHPSLTSKQPGLDDHTLFTKELICLGRCLVRNSHMWKLTPQNWELELQREDIMMIIIIYTLVLSTSFQQQPLQ